MVSRISKSRFRPVSHAETVKIGKFGDPISRTAVQLKQNIYDKLVVSHPNLTSIERKKMVEREYLLLKERLKRESEVEEPQWKKDAAKPLF